jgi:hypothetical protein
MDCTHKNNQVTKPDCPVPIIWRTGTGPININPPEPAPNAAPALPPAPQQGSLRIYNSLAHKVLTFAYGHTINKLAKVFTKAHNTPEHAIATAQPPLQPFSRI